MLRVIIFSLMALVAIAFLAHGFGMTPEQIESRILLTDLNIEEGEAYRNAHRHYPGVTELPSGLQVEVLQLGQGVIPTVDDWVEVHYRGLHLDGREFASTWRWDAPVTVPISKTIKGWQEALVAMPEGTKVRLVIPPSLAYGAAGGGPIGPEETLIFEIELLRIVEPPAPMEIDPLQQRVPGLV